MPLPGGGASLKDKVVMPYRTAVLMFGLPLMYSVLCTLVVVYLVLRPPAGGPGPGGPGDRPPRGIAALPQQPDRPPPPPRLTPPTPPTPPVETSPDPTTDTPPAPTTGTQPNDLLGVPLDRPTAILVDAADLSQPWLRSMHDLLVNRLSQPGGPASLYYLSGGKVQAFSGNPFDRGPDRAGEIAVFQRSIRPQGRSGFWSGLDALLASGQPNVIFVTGRSEFASSADRLVRDIQAANDVKQFVFIQVGDKSDDLQRVANQVKGQLVTTTPEQLQAAATP